jgi:GTF2I-like repeat
MSYKAFTDGDMVADGLPDGVRVQDLNSYGQAMCKQILASSDAISFRREWFNLRCLFSSEVICL